MLVLDVTSSHLKQVGYDQKKKLLFVVFRNTQKYYYHGVPQYVFIGLMKATSMGKYLWKNIRGTFKATKL